MKKLATALLILFLGISYSYSQKTIDFEIYGAPLDSYRFYKSKDYVDPNLNYPNKGADYFDKEFKDVIDDIEKPVAGFLFGIKASQQLTEKFSLQAGLEYSSIGEKANYGLKHLYEQVNINGEQTYLPSTESYHLIMIYTYNYLSVPISVKYNMLTFKNFSLAPSVGLSFDFLLNKQVDNTSENNLISVASKLDFEDHKFKSLSGAINLGLELNYSLTDKLQIYVLPNYKQYFTPNERLLAEYHVIGGETYILDKINKYNYFFGLNFGLRLRNVLNR